MAQSVHTRSVIADDTIREREVFSYYTPLEEQFKCQRQEKSGEKTIPIASPDRALTAFAQLGALRLDVRRTVISLFDRQNQHVLAEATRTLSLQKDDVHDEKDELWLGVTTFPRSDAPCEYGAGLCASEHIGQEQMRDGAIWFDLKAKPFSDLSYVSEYPYARFYAGVPIISPDGFNIGAYSIIDDRPRQGLTNGEVVFLKDMASTVMEHLKMIRAKDELRKSQNMVTGLGNFVDGKSNLGDPWEDATYRQSWKVDRRPESNRPTKKVLSQQSKGNLYHHSKESVVRFGRNRGNEPAYASLPNSHPERPNSTHAQQQSRNTHHTSRLQEDSLSKGVRPTFQRAANILREALELDGAMIMDASVGTFRGLVDKPSPESMTSSPSMMTTTPTFSDAPHVSTTPLLPESKPCVVLGNSISTPIVPSGVEDSANPLPMTECFLHSLLEKYPKGKIWSFDDEETEASQVTAPESSVDSAKSAYRHDEINRKGGRWMERKIIRQLLPGVRSLVFVGMWDLYRDRWFAGSILWSYSPIRVFSHTIELNYLVAFGQSLMVEVARLDAKLADRMKATFITSISHELRTPLHGIMGSSECLQATVMDADQNSLVATIETCGKTLLDTFENLLAFNHLTSRETLLRRSSTVSACSTASHESNESISNHVINLGILVEEVVEASFAGHRAPKLNNIKSAIEADEANSRTTGMLESFRNSNRVHDVSVVLDCQDLTSLQWICHTKPGAWRRLVLNLLGNSLKYTEKGSITVKLEKLPAPPTGPYEVLLTVVDTGKGMSDTFLETRLFVPFAQEDPLAPGTGLGLSIVKQLAESMDGHVSVRSKKCQGTEVQVTIPIEPCFEDGMALDGLVIPPIDEAFRTSHLHVLVDRTSSTLEGEGLSYVFAELCRNWFGMTITVSTELVDADVYVTTQENIGTLARLANSSSSSTMSHVAEAPLIVICQDVALEHTARTQGEADAISTLVEYLPQPFGRNKITKVLASCFDHQQARKARRVSPDGPQSSTPLPTPSDSAYEGSDSGLQLACPETSYETRSVGPVQATVRKKELPDAESQAQHSSTNPPTHSGPSDRPDKARPTTQEQRDLRVLIVDDNKINLQLLAASLKRQKHRYSTAADGLEALQVYRSAARFGEPINAAPALLSPAPSPFDFVLMDVNMPVMDGLESTRQIRAFERQMGLRPAKILAITGSADPELEQEAFASGIDYFVNKPVRFKVLEGMLKRGSLGLDDGNLH